MRFLQVTGKISHVSSCRKSASRAGLGSITVDGVSHLSREIAIFEVRVRS